MSDISHAALHLTLPWPPALGSYYRPVAFASKGGFKGAKLVRTRKARLYRDEIIALFGTKCGFTGPVRLDMECHPPDRRIRDIDNINKAIMDSMTWAGIWGDDSQVQEMTSQFGPVERGGRVRVIITELV